MSELLLQLQASDWSFMLDSGDGADVAERRLQQHHGRALDLAAIATGDRELRKAERHRLEAERRQPGFLHELSGEALWSALLW